MRTILILLLTTLFSINCSAQWQQTNLTSGNVRCINYDGTSFYAGRNNRVYKSTDNGINWSISSYGLTSNSVYSIKFIDTNIFVGADGGVYLSTNNGTSWTIMNNGLTNTTVNDLAVRDTTLFAGTYNGMFRSEDNANSWIQLVNGLPTGGTPPNSILSLGVTGNLILTGVYGASVRASTNNGNSWYSSGSGISIYDNIYGGFAFNGNIIYACSYNGVYVSNNGGGSWIHSTNGLTNLNIRDAVVSDTNVFLATLDGVYLSSMNNNFWTKINNGFPASIAIESLYIKGDTLYAGSINNLGIWYRKLSDIITGIGDNKQTSYNLFPNPTTGKIVIESTKEINSVVIYNTLGTCIFSSNNIKETNYNIDISNYPKGMYLIQIGTGSGKIIEKLFKN